MRNRTIVDFGMRPAVKSGSTLRYEIADWGGPPGVTREPRVTKWGKGARPRAAGVGPVPEAGSLKPSSPPRFTNPASLFTLLLLLSFPVVSSADYVGLEVIDRSSDFPICQDQSEPEIPFPLHVCEVYVILDQPADRLISVGFCDTSTTDPAGFYQHTFGGDIPPACSFIPVFPTLVCDSFVTVGVECDPGGSTRDPDFDSTAFNSSGTVSGGWYNSSPPNSQGFPDANGRVLTARFSYKHNKNTTGNVCVYAKLAGSDDITEFLMQPFDCSVPGMQAGTGGGGAPPGGLACGDPAAGNCYEEEAPPTPFCDCAPCCEDVCAIDMFCCDTEWDLTCAGIAVDECPDANNTGVPDDCESCPGSGDCCVANGTPGCEEPTCCSIVCAIDSNCCGVEWSQECADIANRECHSILDCCCTRAGGFCIGDIDGDGVVGPIDLATVLGAWGSGPLGNPCADFNDDGVVGPIDLAQVLGAWGPCACVAACSATPELFCEEDHRDILDNITPILHDLLCIGLVGIGQPERCPADPNERFYVEMHFSEPTLTYELPDGGPAIGISINFELETITVTILGQETVSFFVPFHPRLRNGALQDAVTIGQSAFKFINALITLSDPCVLREIFDKMGDIYGEPFDGGVVACSQLQCFAANLFISNDLLADLLVVFAPFKCGNIWIWLHDPLVYSPAQIAAIELALNDWRDAICIHPAVCPCDVLPCS